jgi:hypothetical protein
VLIAGIDLHSNGYDTPQARVALRQMAQKVEILNQAFARRYFQKGDPLGRKVRVYNESCVVAGVARNSKHDSLDREPGTMIALLAKMFRGLHMIVGITAPGTGQNERSFVLMWLGIIAFIIAFCAFVFYLMAYVF